MFYADFICKLGAELNEHAFPAYAHVDDESCVLDGGIFK